MPVDVNDESVTKEIKDLILTCGGVSDSFESELVQQLIQNSLRLLTEGHDTGQLKLMTRTIKEMRYAYRIFNKYKGTHRVSIFGSARTPETHSDYLAAKDFSQRMAESGWMCITGGANGIMKAGLEGHREESGFGLAIKLPFEIPTNPFIEGDPKHITFRYFFTRKLMFMSHSDAVAAFPGGFGTMDELYEALTLLQTGKANIVPVVLIEGEKGGYWINWEKFVQKQFIENGWISEEDLSLYYRASSPQDAVDHINHFYRRYHSSRYVKDNFVIRLKETLTAAQVQLLNQKFGRLVQSGDIHLCPPFPEERNELDLPRLTFHHTRANFGLVRQLIDQINDF
jgi:uncharacterized protein (TIGR00730 family)